MSSDYEGLIDLLPPEDMEQIERDIQEQQGIESNVGMEPEPEPEANVITPGRKTGDRLKRYRSREQFSDLSRDDFIMIHKKLKSIIRPNAELYRAYRKIRRRVSEGTWNISTYEKFINLLLGENNTNLPEDLTEKLKEIREQINQTKDELRNEIKNELNKNVYNELYSKCFIYRLTKISSPSKGTKTFDSNDVDKVYTGRPGDAPLKFLTKLFYKHKPTFKTYIYNTDDLNKNNRSGNFTVTINILREYSGAVNPKKVKHKKGVRNLGTCSFSYTVKGKVKWNVVREEPELDYESLRGKGVVKKNSLKGRQACPRYKIGELGQPCVPNIQRRRIAFQNQPNVKRIIKKNAEDNSPIKYRYRAKMTNQQKRVARKRRQNVQKKINKTTQKRIKVGRQYRYIEQYYNKLLKCNMWVYKNDALYIGKSTIPNTNIIGVFANKNIKKDTRFMYEGERIDLEEGDKRENQDYLMMEPNKQYYIDGNPKLSCDDMKNAVSKIVFANEPPVDSEGPNAEFVDHNGKVMLEIIKNIKKGDEIFICYGTGYEDEGLAPRGYSIHEKCGTTEKPEEPEEDNVIVNPSDIRVNDEQYSRQEGIVNALSAVAQLADGEVPDINQEEINPFIEEVEKRTGSRLLASATGNLLQASLEGNAEEVESARTDIRKAAKGVVIGNVLRSSWDLSKSGEFDIRNAFANSPVLEGLNLEDSLEGLDFGDLEDL